MFWKVFDYKDDNHSCILTVPVMLTLFKLCLLVLANSILLFQYYLKTISFLSKVSSHLAIAEYIVGCRGVVQLGGLVLGYPGLVPLRLRLFNLFFSLKVP